MHHVRQHIAVTALFAVTVAVLSLAACSSSGTPKAATTTTATTAPATTGTTATNAPPPTTVSSSAGPATPTSGTSPTSPNPAGAQIAITNFAYSPVSLTVAPGTKVTVVNHDTTAHTVTGTTGIPFDTGTVAAGATGSFTAPTTPGTYPYSCTFHPFMAGTLIVK